MSLFKVILLSDSKIYPTQFAFTAHEDEHTFSNSTPVAFRFSQGG